MGKLYTALNIEEKESTSVFLFLFLSVFLGIFYGAFDVGAHALFLSVYPAEMIPKAYVVSGIAGIILTSLYAKIQNSIPFSRLAWINLVFISVSTALLRILFQYTESSWLIFLIFVMMGPLNIIAMLGFWGAAGRMFTLRQGKRLFGLIDSGQIFGAILSAFAIPVLITFGFQQKNLLFLSSVSIIGALIVQIIISVKYNLNKEQVTNKSEKKTFKDIFKSKYIVYMAIFVVMSMLAAFFIQYSFLSVTKENYPDHNDLTEFLGAFTGSLLLFTFLFKTFVYSKLMKSYGLKFSITVSSFLLIIFTIIAALIGTFGGYSVAANSFVFFFLIISLSRLFSKALKDAVEVPSFKILYQSLKADIRHSVQAYVDGTINEFAALSAGLLLAVLGLFEFFTLIHFSYSLIIILLVWFFVARKLYVEYKRSLQESLAEYKGLKESKSTLSDFVYNNKEVNSSKLISGLEIESSLRPNKFENNLLSLLDSEQKKLKTFVSNKIANSKLISYYDDLISKVKDFDFIEKDDKQYNQLIKIDKSPGTEKLIQLAKSKSNDERILAAFLIGKYYSSDLFIYLKTLIRDLNIYVKIAAIKSAAQTKVSDFCPLIIDYLDTPEVFTYSFEALLQFEEEALGYLDQTFYKSGTGHRVLLRIIKLIGEIKGAKAIEILLKKLDHPNEEILYYTLQALNNCGFKADETNIHHINQIIEKQIGVIGWNIAANVTLNEQNEFEYLKEAVDEELLSNYNLLYLLLSLAYDSKSIMHVKENLESGTSEGIGYALELLDLFISDELKPKLFPVVEDMQDIDRVRQLQNFYAIEKLSIEDLFIDIINRDVNFINIWTKACAIQALIDSKINDVPEDLIAHVFNPIEFLRETALVAINTIQKETYYSLRNRLEDYHIEDFDSTIDLIDESKRALIFDKTMFLKSINYFKTAQGRYLYHLATKMQEFTSEYSDYSNIIVSDLLDKIILIQGNSLKLIIEDEKEVILEANEIYIMSEILSDKIKNLSIKGENSTIYYIQKNDLIYNMFDYYEIENSIIKWYNKDIELKKSHS